MREIKGKYFIMMNMSSCLDNFFTAMYANDVVIAPVKAIQIANLLISYGVDWYGFKIVNIPNQPKNKAIIKLKFIFSFIKNTANIEMKMG